MSVCRSCQTSVTTATTQLLPVTNRDCQNLLTSNQDQTGSFTQFEGGVKLGIGSFNLVGSSEVPQDPQKFLRFLRGSSGSWGFWASAAT